MEELLTEIKMTPLSFDEIKQLSSRLYGRSVPVIDYDELTEGKYPTIQSLFQQSNGIVLYYPSMENQDGVMGHFVALTYDPTTNTVYFFDPYGDKIDSQKPKGDPQNLYNERQNTLIRMLLEAGVNVDYSPHQMQNKKDKSSSVCGRYSIMRANHSELSNDEFYALMKSLRDKYDTAYDNIISLIIQ